MLAYLLKLLGFVLFSVFILYTYYKVGFHNEVGVWYAPYLITIAIAYGIYKFTTLYSKKDTVTFSPLSIGLYALLHVFILCFVYFGLTWGANAGFVLFFKIFGYLLLPTTIVIVAKNLGYAAIRRFVPSFETEDTAFKILLSIGFGFVLFLSALTIVGSLGFYNIWSVAGILIISVAFCYKEILQTLKSLWTYKIEFPNHKSKGNFFDQANLPLVSTEILFLILTFLIGVNFINIVRPMPIGWDDLGVYMNFPQIMANNGTIIKGVGMIAWQTLTGIGFMFHSAPQAFFLNQIGGILSVIVLGLGFSGLLKSSNAGKSESFINLPLLGATMFYAMPMVIFQQAKDMKIDPGLFFVSVIAVYGMLYLFMKYRASLENSTSVVKWQEDIKSPIVHFFAEHKNLIYIFILGTIVGLAFAIKFTTLMLILGLLGVVFYSKLGLAGFFGFFSLFVSVFTKFGLWAQLNVNYPKDDANFLFWVTTLSLGLAAVFFAIAFVQHKALAFKKALLVSLVFIVGIGLPTLPWIVKNISETGISGLSIGTLLGGKGDVYIVDYTKIYSNEELSIIEAKSTSEAINSSGQSQNEDLGRYFGYDRGANNYLKLPLNLTMQSNQPGEYTEITPFFLALIPIIFLFLAFRNPYWIAGLIVILGFEYAYFFHPALSVSISTFFASKNLPEGYIYIALFSFLPLVYFSFALNRQEKKTELFLYNLAFASFYIFLFVIAAYGIVWYGITMYFSFLLMILIGAWYMSEYKMEEGESNGNIVRFFGSLVFFLVVTTYFFASSVPHGWNNLRAAGFNEFKSGTLGQEEGIFSSHPDYFNILATLNVADKKKIYDEAMESVQNPVLKKLLVSNLVSDPTIGKLEQILREVTRIDLSKLGLDQTQTLMLKKDARVLLNSLYQTVLYPQKEERNAAGIYRIGTFLTYFIDNNRSRFYDDSLVFNLDKYFYHENPNMTVERMKKLGLKYLLVDLNAATIDKDPRHDLTRRFENLLLTFRSDRLKLVQTDSICLQIALEEKNPETYLSLAGVNYESYKKNEQWVQTTITRGQKQFECYNHILDLIKAEKITDKSYSYLLPLANYMKQNPPKDQNEMIRTFQSYVGHGWLVLFEIL